MVGRYFAWSRQSHVEDVDGRCSGPEKSGGAEEDRPAIHFFRCDDGSTRKRWHRLSFLRAPASLDPWQLTNYSINHLIRRSIQTSLLGDLANLPIQSGYRQRWLLQRQSLENFLKFDSNASSPATIGTIIARKSWQTVLAIAHLPALGSAVSNARISSKATFRADSDSEASTFILLRLFCWLPRISSLLILFINTSLDRC
jgi:hypothetical protein